MKQTIALLGVCVCAGSLCASGRGQTDSDRAAILEKARAAEIRVETGSLSLLETTHHVHQTSKEIKRAVGADGVSSLKGALQIESETPPETKGKRLVLFDNQRNALLINYSNDHQVKSLRVYLDDKVTKSYSANKNVTDPRYPYTPKFTTTAPLPRWNDYNLLLVSRFWRGLDTDKAQTRQVNGQLFVDLPLRYGFKQRVELDPNQNYAIKSLTLFDLKHHHIHSEIQVTRTLRDGIWYPSAITQTEYDVNALVDKKVISTIDTEVQSAMLNLPVSESDLSFGDVPPDTHVTDERFGKTLDYQQGTKQFTDGEIQKLSSNPDKFHRAVAESSVGFVKIRSERDAKKHLRAFLTAVVALSAGTFLILCARRILRGNA